MSSTQKIVLSGYYGFDNIGDEAVLYSIVSLLRKEIPNVEITVLSNNPEKTSTTYNVQSVNRWNLKEVTKVIKQSDLLISGGGSLLQDVTSSKTVPYYLAIVKIAQVFKKKVVFYSQGIGPVNKSFSRWLIKYVVNKVDGIFVREPASKALLEEIGIRRPVHVAIDPVIGIEVPQDCQAAIKTIGVYIRPWKDEVHDQNLIKGLKDGLEMALEAGYKLCLIPMHYEQDRKIAYDLKEALEADKKEVAEKIEVVDKMLSIEEVLRYTASFDFVVGMRLHSLIMAAAAKVPMIALSYDPKVTAFMKEIEVPYCIDSDAITPENFREKLGMLMSSEKAQRTHLKKIYEKKKEKIYLPVNGIKEQLIKK